MINLYYPQTLNPMMSQDILIFGITVSSLELNSLSKDIQIQAKLVGGPNLLIEIRCGRQSMWAGV